MSLFDKLTPPTTARCALVNLQDLQLTVFQDPSPLGYLTVTNLQDGAVSPLAFPNISIEVRRLFEVNRSS